MNAVQQKLLPSLDTFQIILIKLKKINCKQVIHTSLPYSSWQNCFLQGCGLAILLLLDFYAEMNQLKKMISEGGVCFLIIGLESFRKTRERDENQP